ncbi:membrane protein insertion efficiency factor YidD, partial [Streptomyces sp. SID8455]|nr:membrane protein insertion efficiency factor YidD [Streptomyces sp. SID8455]
PWSPGGVDHVPPRKRPRWHELLRNGLRGGKGGEPAADVPSGGSVSETPSPATETSPNAQGA